jgi:hypothetical protein
VVTAVATPTPAPTATVAPTTTITFGKHYAIGDPGSYLGSKFGSNSSPTGTGGPAAAVTTEATLKPGSRAYGITPPKGQFIRWYPAARWAAGIK